MSETDPIEKLLAGVEFKPNIKRGEPEVLGGWSLRIKVPLPEESRVKFYVFSKGLIEIDAYVHPNSISFGWDANISDALIPGDASNYSDLIDLALENLPRRVDTQDRNAEQLREDFRSHSTVELGYVGQPSVKYKFDDPDQAQQFSSVFVNDGDRIRSLQIIGRDLSGNANYKYVLTLDGFNTSAQRIGLSVPFQRAKNSDWGISWSSVMEWALETHAQRRLIYSPKEDGMYLGGAIYDLIAPGNPPAQNSSRV